MLDLIGLLKHTQSRKAKYTNSVVKAGFTLIELAIALVIIGFLTGGVLVGNDLIKAAEVRAQIQQIEKYNGALNTFKIKYNGLPADLPISTALAYGFTRNGATWPIQNDELIACYWSGQFTGWAQTYGECLIFWNDLSFANLIDGTFNTAVEWTTPPNPTVGSDIDKYYPKAKIGNGNYVYVWSNFANQFFPNTSYIGLTRGNYFGISAATSLGTATFLNSNPGMSVNQAYAIDSKMDDGFPQTGKVLAVYINVTSIWTDGTRPDSAPPKTTATPASATTCYDNGNASGVSQTYSTAQNNGNGINCALSFKFQ